jgi:imidazolonepropionase-like amidohydrolase
MSEKIEGEDARMRKEPLAKLFRGAKLYCPDYKGQGDILVTGGIIARIAPRIPVHEDFLDLEIIDATDKFLTPGLIDHHVDETISLSLPYLQARNPRPL